MVKRTRLTKRPSSLKGTLKKWSLFANISAAISAAGFGVLVIFADYLELWPLFGISITLAILGILGKVIKDEIEDDEDNSCSL